MTTDTTEKQTVADTVGNSHLIDTLVCRECNGTGIVKYKEIDEFTSRQWVPWITKPCPNGCKVL